MLVSDFSFSLLPANLPPSLQALQSIRHDQRERILQGLYFLVAADLSIGQEMQAVDGAHR